MVTTLPQVKITTTNIPAILVTGSDAKGNEYSYRKSGDEWVDYYNECVTTPERIRRDVFPNVRYVRYQINGVLEYKMSRYEWIENGCPLDLPKSIVVELMDSQLHPVNEAQAVEKEIDDTLRVGSEVVVMSTPSKVTVSRSWAARHLNVDVNGFDAELDKAFGKGNWILA